MEMIKIFRLNFSNKRIQGKYVPERAVYYARKYALKRNANYEDFSKRGGDCTNFISQCLDYGGLPYSYTWKPYTHPWLRVNELYYYLLNSGKGIDITKNKIYSEGDIIQFYSSQKGFFSHSIIITKVLDNGEYLYCCHSDDKKDFPLNYVYPSFYSKIRVIKINTD